MAESFFEMGEREKHWLTVDYNLLTGRIIIELDGEKPADEYHYWPPGAAKFSFDVGSSEVHKIEVRVGRFSPLEVLVDGKPARSSST
jgi:hypothetical protein